RSGPCMCREESRLRCGCSLEHRPLPAPFFSRPRSSLDSRLRGARLRERSGSFWGIRSEVLPETGDRLLDAAVQVAVECLHDSGTLLALNRLALRIEVRPDDLARSAVVEFELHAHHSGDRISIHLFQLIQAAPHYKVAA